jgi:hypothetical protein
MEKASDIVREQEERRENRMAAMGPVITQIQAKVRQQAIYNPNAPYIVYEVPTYVFGYPLYPMKDAFDFLTREYSKAGYWVWIVENKYLFISWLKPVKGRDGGRPMLMTNYRPMAYDPTTLAFLPNER